MCIADDIDNAAANDTKAHYYIGANDNNGSGDDHHDAADHDHDNAADHRAVS